MGVCDLGRSDHSAASASGCWRGDPESHFRGEDRILYGNVGVNSNACPFLPCLARWGQVDGLDGVMGHQRAHFWSFTSKIVVGSLHVISGPDADKQAIRHHVSHLFRSIGVSHVTVQVGHQYACAVLWFHTSHSYIALSLLVHECGA